MSRELRFVLILFASIFGVCIVAGIAAVFFLGSTVAHIEQSSTPDSRRRIAEKIAPVPKGYRVASATEILFTRNATLKSADNGMSIMLQSNSIPGATVPNANENALPREAFHKTMQLMLGRMCPKPVPAATERILVKNRTILLDVFECPEGRIPFKSEYGQFQGRSGPATITAIGTPANWDAEAVREVLGAAPSGEAEVRR
jgi:hypothetical protein